MVDMSPSKTLSLLILLRNRCPFTTVQDGIPIKGGLEVSLITQNFIIVMKISTKMAIVSHGVE